MSAATASTRGRVLLGTVGHGDDWSELRNHLVGLGWQVDPFEPLPHPGDETDTDLALPRLDDVDHVVVVVPAGGVPSAGATGRLAHAIGVLQGRLGFGRVIVLVDEEVESFPFGTGTTEIRFKRGEVADRFSQVAAELAESDRSPDAPGYGPPGLAKLLERLRVDEHNPAPEWWLIGGLLTVLAVAVFVSLLQLGGSGEAPSDRVTAGPLIDVLADAAFDPAAGRAGSVTALPATCVLDTETGVLAEEIPCEGAGGLRLVGYTGPWYDGIGLVSVDSGVVVDLMVRIGDPSAVATEVALGPGAEQAIPGAVAGTVVDEIMLRFSANGQRVRLHQHPDQGGNEVTFTFNLDR